MPIMRDGSVMGAVTPRSCSALAASSSSLPVPLPALVPFTQLHGFHDPLPTVAFVLRARKGHGGPLGWPPLGPLFTC